MKLKTNLKHKYRSSLSDQPGTSSDKQFFTELECSSGSENDDTDNKHLLNLAY